MTGIFISYRPEHTTYLVGRLHDRLATHFGAGQVVRDVKTIDPLDDFGQRIDEVVGSSAAFLAVISTHWLVNRNPVGKRPIGIPRDWVQREVEVALRRPGVLVVPVLVEGATMPTERELPDSVRSLAMRPTMRLSDLGWEGEVDKLIQALEQVVEPRGAPSATRPGGSRSLPAGQVAAPRPPTSTRRWFKRS